MPLDLKEPLTVGAITDSRALENTFSLQDCDLVELRLDALGGGEEVVSFCKRHEKVLPLLITARDPQQGGQNNLSHTERESLLRMLLPFASAVDLEAANLLEFADLRAQASADGCLIVASHHDFEGFLVPQIREILKEVQKSENTVAKAAVTLNSAADLAAFEALAAEFAGTSFSLMGMGRYAQVSRLLAAQHGSLLNYGYLGDQATAPGQWPAPLLKQAIAATPVF